MVKQRELDALYRQKLELFAMRSLSELEPTNATEYNWHIGCVCEHLQAVWDKEIRRLIINIPPRSLKTHLSSIAFPSWGFGQDPSVNFMLTSHKFDLAKAMTRKTRQVMQTEWYQQLNPHVQFAKDQNAVNHFVTTQHGQYLAGAMESVTGSGADIQMLDDPHNPTEAVSDVQRMNVIDTIRSTLFSRFNDPRTGRFILIMQRLHAEDATGNLLQDEGWTHLKIPAEAPSNTFIELRGKKWEYDKSGLFFPERFTHDVLEEKKRELGPYSYCTPAHTPITMADLSDKNISEIKVGDFVLGWDQGDYRKKLTPSEVVAIHEKYDYVYEYKLQNGDIVQCTQDHEWYTSRSGKDSHKPYLPAEIGRKLMKVCDPIKVYDDLNSAREMGWVAGFFDGDGSVTNQGGITFTQGTDRNLHLCERLESLLNKLSINYNYADRVRSDRINVSDHKIRQYNLSQNIDTTRCMLHTIMVSKWRDRLIELSYKTRFIKERPMVVSKKLISRQKVYGLTTKTGNYVAWGYASKNCGQYLQNPVPLGGGEFKDSFFQYYKVGAFNARGCNTYILVDPNREKKKSSDYTAMAVIALAPDQNYYLVDGIREILDPKERANELFRLHRKWSDLSGKPPKVGYEHYGAEVDLFYIREKQREESYRFHIKEIRGKGAKEDRIRRLIPDMSDLRFYLPEDLYYKSSKGLISNFMSDIVEQEFLLFPVSPHDDFMDAMSMIYDIEPVFPKQAQQQFESYNNDSMSVFDL